MTLRIDVNVPPRLIERAREQQVERRLAKAAEQRQAVVRKEAARQVALQRLATGKDAQGNDVRGGALEDQRRRWFGAQAMMTKYQIGSVNLWAYSRPGYPENMTYKTKGGTTIVATMRPDNAFQLATLLPIHGASFILLRYLSAYAGDTHEWFVCNDTAARSLGGKLGDIARKIYSIRTNLLDDGTDLARYGVGSVQPALYGEISFQVLDSTAAIYYLIKDIQLEDWRIRPVVALAPGIQRAQSVDTREQIEELQYYSTRSTGGTLGLPMGWWENYESQFDYPSFEDPYWMSQGFRKAGGSSIWYPNEYQNMIFTAAYTYNCWDWGRPDFCREQLLSLGFSPEDLIP